MLSRLLSFFVVAYLARTFGPASMGFLAIGTAILAYGSIFADSGLPILGTRLVAAGQLNLKSLVRRIRSARLVLSVITLIVGSGILFFWVRHSTTKTIALVYLLYLFPSALLLDWVFQGLRSMTTLAKGRILGMIVYLVFILLFVSKTSSIYLVPAGWVIGGFAQALFFWTTYGKLETRETENKESLPTLSDTLRQGLPLGVANLISQFVIQFPFIYMGLVETAETTGIYSIAFRVIILLLVVDRVFYTIFFPTISRSFKEGLDSLERKFDRTLKFVTTGAFYIGIVSIIASRFLFPLLFGSEFRDSSLIFQLLIVYFILTVINSVFTFTLIGIEKERIYTRSLGVGALTFFALMLLPIPIASELIAPVALTFFQLVSLIIMSRELQKLIPIALFRRVFVPIVVSTVLILILTRLEQVSPVLSVIAALLLSLPVLALASGMNKKDLAFIKQLIV